MPVLYFTGQGRFRATGSAGGVLVSTRRAILGHEFTQRGARVRQITRWLFGARTRCPLRGRRKRASMSGGSGPFSGPHVCDIWCACGGWQVYMWRPAKGAFRFYFGYGEPLLLLEFIFLIIFSVALFLFLKKISSTSYVLLYKPYLLTMQPFQ